MENLQLQEVTIAQGEKGREQRQAKADNLKKLVAETQAFVRANVIARLATASDEEAQLITALYPFKEWRQVYEHVLTVH